MIDLKNLETIKRRMKNTYIYHDDIESTKDDSQRQTAEVDNQN